MPWEIVILVGGGYALASGSKVAFESCPFLIRYFFSYFTDQIITVLGGKSQSN